MEKKGGAFCVFQYRKTTEKELCRLWNRSILEHPFDRRYRAWKRAFLQLNRDGTGATFAVLHNGTPVGEGTLLFSPQADAVRGREWLADGVHTANINALRIRKAYEGQGHISALLKEMERYAAARGFTRLTIGVEKHETRSRAIYRHWGYTAFLAEADEDGEIVLYYAKTLRL